MEWKNRLVNYMLILFLAIALWIVIGEIKKDVFNPVILLSASTFALSLALSLFLFNRRTLVKEEKYVVKFDEECISCFHPDKPDETISWKEISEIVISTTDKGPDQPYIWFVLTAENGKGCVFPLGAKNSRMAIEKILGFPGLDLAVWAQALNSTANKRFIVWNRQAKGS